MLVFESWLKDFMPLIATIPLAIAAFWISNRWMKLRHGDAELRAEIDALRQEQVAMQERLDFAERLLSQLREAHLELPKST